MSAVFRTTLQSKACGVYSKVNCKNKQTNLMVLVFLKLSAAKSILQIFVRVHFLLDFHMSCLIVWKISLACLSKIGQDQALDATSWAHSSNMMAQG